MRVGAMECPRDVPPNHAPVQILDPAGGAPIETDFSADIVDRAEELARLHGISLERYMERVILAAVRRDAEGLPADNLPG